ncbi:glycosyltransferase involved in cell wall biosynthesis [Salinibacter ruber]|uniref:glycosyltransferase family 4 protein n=1 Tax=Salinibacter ruber TaxID=146919 RepID=UPI0021696992|nr:glycosyltransferase [Salinibacter ruber]MCS3827491.1 glycosyltransferase involved in cell wall biosynthesis [Salinibacter ruber]
MRVLVAHPGRQHSHELAQALYQRDGLAGYWTGVPAANPSTKGPLYRLIAGFSPQPTIGLPGRVVTHNYIAPLIRRVMEQTAAKPRIVDVRHRAAGWFDTWAARRLPASLDAVVAYENAARETFRVAREQGTTTILDAASSHYTWQDAFYDPVEPSDVHDRINARKQEEIRLADHVLTVSELAHESYVDAGVSPQRVTSVPMGADLSEFTPRSGDSDTGSEPVTFIFAGHAGRLKGVDVLLRASERLSGKGHTHCVQFAGGADDGVFRGTRAPIERLGYLCRSELAVAMQRADVLVLPSRHDSFGRVVVEALATGLPAIVTEHVGAKEVIEDGKTGWVVSANDVDALAAQMHWCIEHPDAVRRMKVACVEAAQDYSWAAYRSRVTEVIKEVLV